MEYSFLEIINMLNQNLPMSDNFAFRLAQNANSPDRYYLSRFLPDMQKPDWHTTGGTLTITPQILGDVPMDTDFPPMGNMESDVFFMKTSKFGGQMFFSEAQQRELIQMENSLRVSASIQNINAFGDFEGQMRMFSETGRADDNTINGARINRIFGIINSIMISHYNTREYLRGEVMTEGKLDYTFNDVKVNVDYKLGSQITTYTGNDRFDQSESKFWDWIEMIYSELDEPVFIANQAAYLKIVNNDVNKIRDFDLKGTERRINKYRDNVIVQKNDPREDIMLRVYSKAGSIMNPATKSLVSKPFIKDRRIIAVGGLNVEEIELTLGGMTDPDNELRLGYTHIGPTIEAGGRSGIWARIYTPEGKPQQVLAETAVNMLPVVTNRKKIYIAKW